MTTDIAQIEADLANDPIFWECVREEAEELLAADPGDTTARRHLDEYEQWRRTYFVPKKWTGFWKQTDAGWRLKTAKGAKAGDTCLVRLKSSDETRLFVLDEGGEGLWLGHRVDQ
jgi:hypothetical protein